MTGLRRGTFLAGGAALGAIALGPRGVRAETPLKVGTLPIDLGGTAYYAEELGMFKKAGLDAQVQTLNYGSAVAAAVAGGAIDIGQSNIMSLATAHERGLPFVMIAGAGLFLASKPTSMMLVLKDSPLRTARDLAGKAVAVNGLKNVTQVSVENWVDRNGGDSARVRFIEMPFSEMEAALVAKRVDAALFADPVATKVLDDGKTRAFADTFASIGKRWMIGAWFAKRDWVAANRETVQKFVAVMREAGTWANDHQAQSATILQKYTKVRVGRANRVVYDESLDPALVQPQIDVAARYKVLKAAFPASEMIASLS